MFPHQGVWFPDGEAHFPEWMTKNGEVVDGCGTYQIKKYREALKWVRSKRLAVDVGGHVGLWSMQMLKHFQAVVAFEPVAAFRECFKRNVTGENVVLHPCALGSKPGKVTMTIPALAGGIDSGGTHVSSTAEDGTVDLRTLDSFALPDVDFVKIDCEGYEHQVIEGARYTLRLHRPCVIVEQKPHKLGPNFGIKGTPAVDMLKDMGAVVRREISGDYILSWD